MGFIEGDSVVLRKIELSDVNSTYLSWIEDEDVTKGLLTGYFPSTIDGLKNYIENVMSNENAVMFAVCDKENNKHIGNIKLDNFDWIGKTAEMGLMIGEKDYWGKGIGREICELVINYAFDKLNFRKILLAVYSNNPGALSLYEKLGFENEGILKEHVFVQGEYIDKHLMSIFNKVK